MVTYLLDTNTVIYILHDKFRLRDKVAQVGISNCFVSEITIAELYYGTYNSIYVENNLRQIEVIKLLFGILPISNSLVEFGKIQAFFNKLKIRHVGTNDVFIGATALSGNHTVVTNNHKDFLRMEGVSIRKIGQNQNTIIY